MGAGGSVILTGSAAASSGVGAFGVYAASKAALRSFARTLAVDLKSTGIRINVLSPSVTDTPAVWQNCTPEIETMIRESVTRETPLGRIGTPEEVANAALFLASEESSYMTGGEIFLDGGSAQI